MSTSEHEFQARVAKVLRFRSVSALPWVALLAHIGSVVAITVAYFGRDGRISFDVRSWLDWTIASAMAVALFIGVRYVLRDARVAPRELTRKQLTDFINHTRYCADRKVVTVAGDLTWLSEDEACLKDLVLRRHLDVRVYYRPKALSPEVTASMQALVAAGVDFRPYPEGVDAPFRCTLIDIDSADEVRLCIYRRLGKKVTGTLRSAQKFEWLEHEGGHDRMIRAVQAFLWAAERRAVATITVGISGTNNVGKTSLALALQRRLGTMYGVTYYPDVFRDATSTKGLEPNYLMLITQLWHEALPTGDVALFDRTAVDNFCYLQIKNSDGASPARADAIPIVVAAAKKLDLIILVRRQVEDWTTRTTHVRPNQRKRASEWLERFYREHGVTIDSVELNGRSLEAAAMNAANEIAIRIESLAEQRRIRKKLTGWGEC